MVQCVKRILEEDLCLLDNEDLVLRYLTRQKQRREFRLTPQIQAELEFDIELIVDELKSRGLVLEM